MVELTSCPLLQPVTVNRQTPDNQGEKEKTENLDNDFHHRSHTPGDIRKKERDPDMPADHERRGHGKSDRRQLSLHDDIKSAGNGPLKYFRPDHVDAGDKKNQQHADHADNFKPSAESIIDPVGGFKKFNQDTTLQATIGTCSGQWLFLSALRPGPRGPESERRY
jgi:hypothetical protein